MTLKELEFESVEQVKRAQLEEVNIHEHGDYALHYAAKTNNMDLVVYLEKQGFQYNYNTLTLLRDIVKNRYTKILKHILKHKSMAVTEYMIFANVVVPAIKQNDFETMKIGFEFYFENQKTETIDEYLKHIIKALDSATSENIIHYIFTELDIDINEHGTKLFNEFIEANNLKMLKCMVELGYDIHIYRTSPHHFGSAVYAAAKTGDLKVVKYFVEGGYKYDEGNPSYVIYPIINDNLELLKYLVSLDTSENPFFIDSLRTSEAHINAIINNAINITKYLHEQYRLYDEVSGDLINRFASYEWVADISGEFYEYVGDNICNDIYFNEAIITEMIIKNRIDLLEIAMMKGFHFNRNAQITVNYINHAVLGTSLPMLSFIIERSLIDLKYDISMEENCEIFKNAIQSQDPNIVMYLVNQGVGIYYG